MDSLGKVLGETGRREGNRAGGKREEVGLRPLAWTERAEGLGCQPDADGGEGRVQGAGGVRLSEGDGERHAGPSDGARD